MREGDGRARRKGGAAPPRPAREAPRQVVATGGRGRRYPALRRAALAAAGGLALAGCADPVCSSSGLEELGSHGKAGAVALADLELEAGLRELSVGLGLSPHPHPPMMAGVMIAPAPHMAPPAHWADGEDEPPP